MGDITVAGLKLDGSLNEGDSPLEAIVCIKVMSVDGHMDWEMMATGGLHTVEAMGAAEFMRGQLKRGAFGDDDE